MCVILHIAAIVLIVTLVIHAVVALIAGDEAEAEVEAEDVGGTRLGLLFIWRSCHQEGHARLFTRPPLSS